jgi:antitoxin component YwqK of YwqJK toxin-antitoxin module
MERYEVTDNRFILVDEELELSIEEPFHGTESSTYYPDGILKSVCFTVQDLLHGPSSFFSQEGVLLSKSWFYFGTQQGKMQQYFLSGKLCSIQRFKDGMREGKQEYFYEDGTKKTVMHYQKGVLHGEVHLYFPSGNVKRHTRFCEGKKEEFDQIFEEDGVLLC